MKVNEEPTDDRQSKRCAFCGSVPDGETRLVLKAGSYKGSETQVFCDRDHAARWFQTLLPPGGPLPEPDAPSLNSPSGKTESELVGYIRRSLRGGALKINICAQAFEKARRYTSQDGNEYVGLVVSLDKVKSIIEGEREVTSVCQIVEVQ